MINIQYDMKTGLASCTMEAADAVELLQGAAKLAPDALTDLIDMALKRVGGLVATVRKTTPENDVLKAGTGVGDEWVACKWKECEK
jgi:hypothetical protein